MPFGGQRDSGTGWREAGHRGARRLLRLEDGLRHPRSRPRCERAERRRPRSRRGRARSACPGKNVRELAGHPLIAYSIAAARESGVFDAVVVSTDSRGDRRRSPPLRRRGARACGPAELATATSPDIEWVRARAGAAATRTRLRDPAADEPVPQARRRSGARASGSSSSATGADSIRAVELVPPAPGQDVGARAATLMRAAARRSPSEACRCHSRQYQALPQVYVQNSSLEIAWTRVLDGRRRRSPARRVAPFFTEGAEGFSIDYPDDFERAEALGSQRAGELPAAAAACEAARAVSARATSRSTELERHPHARRRPGRARGGVRRRLPDQRALHDRARRLGPHRHELQLHRHRRLAAPRGARARATATSPPRATTRPALYAVLIGARASSPSTCSIGCAGWAACPATRTSPPRRRWSRTPARSGWGSRRRRGFVRADRLAGRRGARLRAHRRRRAAGGPVLGVAAADREPRASARSP